MGGQSNKPIEEDKIVHNFNQNDKSLNSTSIQNVKFTCKYDPPKLINQLNSFINEIMIQDSIFDTKKSLKDSVFDMINKKEKEELIEFLSNEKNNYINKISYYLNNKQNLNFNGLAVKLMNEENYFDTYKEKVKNEITKINNDVKSFEINYLTIILIGKSGVGKSTLVNSLLQFSGKNKIKTGVGGICTRALITPYKSDKMPFLRLVDTRGIELKNDKNKEDFGADKITNVCVNFINQQKETKDINNFVHCIWYCVTGNRFEDVEFDSINRLKNAYKCSSNIPIIIVYTQALDKSVSQEMKNYIRAEKNINDEFVEILAKEKNIVSGQSIKPYGLDELIKTTINECKKSFSGDMHSVMTSNISEYIAQQLINENLNIKKYINENNILDFINGYKIKTAQEFKDYVINIYGKNIKYYLNKDLDKNGYNLIEKSQLINEHLNQFINYYQNEVDKTISDKLSPFAVKGLMIQADVEIKRGKSTLIQNKKSYQDFFSSNEKFLKDNLYYLAQKNYIGINFSNLFELFSNLFMKNINNSFNQILSLPKIKEKITNLFSKRFSDFEEKIKKKKIPLLSNYDNFDKNSNNGSNNNYNQIVNNNFNNNNKIIKLEESKNSNNYNEYINNVKNLKKSGSSSSLISSKTISNQSSQKQIFHQKRLNRIKRNSSNGDRSQGKLSFSNISTNKTISYNPSNNYMNGLSQHKLNQIPKQIQNIPYKNKIIYIPVVPNNYLDQNYYLNRNIPNFPKS